MAYIISFMIAYLGYRVTGYDFFVLLTLISISLDIYKDLTKYFKILKRYLIYAKDKTARRVGIHFNAFPGLTGSQIMHG